MHQTFGKDRSVVPEISSRRDREIHRHTNRNTCAPLTGVCKAMNASFVIPCFIQGLLQTVQHEFLNYGTFADGPLCTP